MLVEEQISVPGIQVVASCDACGERMGIFKGGGEFPDMIDGAMEFRKIHHEGLEKIVCVPCLDKLFS